MGKSAKKAIKPKPKSHSKMSRGKKKVDLGKISKQEKKFHQKVKSNVPLKKNTKIYQKNKPEVKLNKKQKSKSSLLSMDTEYIDDGERDEEEEEMILPLDMLSDGDEDENQDAESYERLPRSSFNNSNQQRPLLPIKTDRGQLIAQSVPITESENIEETDDDEDKEVPSTPPAETEPAKPVSVVELIAERERKLNETKQTIVTLCDVIMKNPYEEISNLKQLRSLLNLGDPLISMTIRKLTMLSLVELFRDIVPGYRIRSLKEQSKDDDEQMKNMKNKKQMKKETLSKDVKAIRHFEQTLLKHYQFFVHFLEQCAKKNLPENQLKKSKTSNQSIPSSKLNLGHLAIQCLCKLLTYLHHFNFRANLLNTIVQYMANR